MTRVRVRKELEEKMKKAAEEFKGKPLPRWIKDWINKKRILEFNPVLGKRVPRKGREKVFFFQAEDGIRDKGM